MSSDEHPAPGPGPEPVSKTPPPDLVEGEVLLWKMADVKGFFTRRVVTGYLITNYRCFVWDAEANVVMASVPTSRCETVVSYMHMGKRTIRGGRFLEPPPAEPAPPPDPMTTIGDVAFRVDDKTIMVFREVNEPERLKQLVDFLKVHAKRPTDERLNAVVTTAHKR